MGWAKYTEDNNEIILERMRIMSSPIKQYPCIIKISPMKTNEIQVSIGVNSSKDHVTHTEKTRDEIFYCCDCGKSVVFSVGEQYFYKKNSLHHPKRCKSCREKNRIRQLAFH